MKNPKNALHSHCRIVKKISNAFNCIVFLLGTPFRIKCFIKEREGTQTIQRSYTNDAKMQQDTNSKTSSKIVQNYKQKRNQKTPKFRSLV